MQLIYTSRVHLIQYWTVRQNGERIAEGEDKNEKWKIIKEINKPQAQGDASWKLKDREKETEDTL